MPVAISVLGSAEIDRQDIRAATDLNKIVPGLQICCGRGNTNFAFLRGLLGIVSYFAEVPQSSVGFGNYFDVSNVPRLSGLSLVD